MIQIKKTILTLVALLAVALTANAVNLNLYLTTDGLVADPNSSTPYATTDKSIEEGTVVTINYSGVDNTYTVFSIYINGEVVSSGRIMQMGFYPYTFTAKKNCILRVQGAYAFNFPTKPNVYFTQDVDVDVTGVTLSQTEAAMKRKNWNCLAKAYPQQATYGMTLGKRNRTEQNYSEVITQ